MKTFIKVSRFPYEEPHLLNLVIEASNGRSMGQIEIYANTADLIDIASRLEVFPRHPSDVFLYEIGSERLEDRFAYYFRFRVFNDHHSGRFAVHFRFNNNRNFPDLEISEFCFPIEVSDLNKLGRLFRSFSKLEQEILFWEPNSGRLFMSNADFREDSGQDPDHEKSPSP